MIYPGVRVYHANLFVLWSGVGFFISDCEIDCGSSFLPFQCKMYYGYADEYIYCTSEILYQTICIPLYSRNNDLCCDTTVEYM